MDKNFQQQIGKNIEVYVNNMVVKSEFVDDHANDLKEIFDQI